MVVREYKTEQFFTLQYALWEYDVIIFYCCKHDRPETTNCVVCVWDFITISLLTSVSLTSVCMTFLFYWYNSVTFCHTSGNISG